MAKNNKALVAAELAKENLNIGYYDESIDKVSVKELEERVLPNVCEGHTDLVVKIRGQQYVVEVTTVDNEVDLMLYSKVEYMEKYGWEQEKEDKFLEYEDTVKPVKSLKTSTNSNTGNKFKVGQKVTMLLGGFKNQTLIVDSVHMVGKEYVYGVTLSGDSEVYTADEEHLKAI